MKTFFITTIAFLAFSITCKAQWTAGTGIITTTNSVGIGTTSPSQALQVNGNILISNSSTIGFNNDISHYYIQGIGNGLQYTPFSVGNFTFSSGNGNWSFTNGNVGIGITAPAAKLHVLNLYDINNTTALNLFYQSTWGTAAYASSFRFMDIASTEGGKILELNGYGMGIGYDPPAYLSPDKLYVNGNVAIGTTNPQGYKLAVNGTAIATSMTVKAYANWPDYVFKSTYKLLALTEVKTYIDQNHHLPDVPSATEVEKNGLNLGEMNKILVQKVEELTLYLIEQNKQLSEQNIKLADQQKINHVIEQQSKLLKSQQEQIDELKRSLGVQNYKKSK